MSGHQTAAAFLGRIMLYADSDECCQSRRVASVTALCGTLLIALLPMVAKVCYNTPEQLPNLTTGATFFHHAQNQPPWLCDVQPVTTIGNHRFCVQNRGTSYMRPGAGSPETSLP